MVATGFIVDAARGLVLTNRHVVSPGPVRADAIFHNKEEVELDAIYRDPVHDFGFFRFDPAALKFCAPVAIPLAPEMARVGVELRVVGNDAGEKLSILAGTMARLDRDAPDYGSAGYNDFNTFYYSAASSTSGGSSGSPVLNVAGQAVALNAGGARKAASAYFLPLDRVARALALLQAHPQYAPLEATAAAPAAGAPAAAAAPAAAEEGAVAGAAAAAAAAAAAVVGGAVRHRAAGVRPGSELLVDAATLVPRGTLQAVFKHKAFDEARRLGLPPRVEELVRGWRAEETGVLVVDQVVPGGPADGVLKPGDVLLRVAQPAAGGGGGSAEAGGGGAADGARDGEAAVEEASVEGLSIGAGFCTGFLPLEGALDDAAAALAAAARSKEEGEAAVTATGGGGGGGGRGGEGAAGMAGAAAGAGTVTLTLVRGGALLVVTLGVGDLHAITPSSLLEVSGCVIHPLSYHQAKNHNLPVGGAYMGKSGHMLSRAGMQAGSVFTAVGGVPTPDVAAFGAAFAALPNGSRTVLRYFALRDRHRTRSAFVTVDRTWFAMQTLARCPDGIWRAAASPPPPPPPPRAAVPARPTPVLVEGSPVATSIFRALVLVAFDCPYLVDGISRPSAVGAGLVVDARRGLVLVDRATVPIALGDVLVTVAASLELRAKVGYCPTSTFSYFLLTRDSFPTRFHSHFSTCCAAREGGARAPDA
jgi:S1-C subfamily serine protease